MGIFYLILGVLAFFILIGAGASVRRLAVAVELLTAHNLRFPAPDAKTIEPGQVVYMEPFMKHVRILEVNENPEGWLDVKIESADAPEHTFAPEAL